MIQTLYCHNGDHYYDREAVRGRVAVSCEAHGGTGIVVKAYRKGSKAGETAFASKGGSLRDRKAAAPRKVPVRIVPGSEEGSTEDEYPISITLQERFTYKPETRPGEQRATLTARFADHTAVALVAPEAPTTVDTHSGEFWCEVGQHWAPRKSNRGRPPKVCDEHKQDADYQAEQNTAIRAVAEHRGERIASALDELLRSRGSHLSQNADRYALQFKWAGRWENHGVTFDNTGRRFWLQDDRNASLVKSGRFRLVKVESV